MVFLKARPWRGLGGAGFCGGLFEKSPPHPPKTPQQKGLLPSEGSANNVLPFFVRHRGVFARRCCNTDSGFCPARSWTSSKPRPTGCERIVAVNISLPCVKGGGKCGAFDGRSLRDLGICAHFILHALSFHRYRGPPSLPEGGLSNHRTPLYLSPCGAGFHRGAISSTVGGFHPSARESLADRISLRAKRAPLILPPIGGRACADALPARERADRAAGGIPLGRGP